MLKNKRKIRDDTNLIWLFVHDAWRHEVPACFYETLTKNTTNQPQPNNTQHIKTVIIHSL